MDKISTINFDRVITLLRLIIALSLISLGVYYGLFVSNHVKNVVAVAPDFADAFYHMYLLPTILSISYLFSGVYLIANYKKVNY